MKGKWVSFGVLVALAAGLLNVMSCGRDQELVSIQIQPATETFGAANIALSQDAGAQVQLQALGSYIHPPVTKDITDQATWTSNTPQMVTVNSTALITVTGNACGNTLISAAVETNKSVGGISSSGAIVNGYMTANVVCPTGSSGGSGGGGGTGLPVTLTFAGNGAGTVSSSPAGLSCASSAQLCATLFPSSTVLSLTATPTGSSTFGGWSGCNTPATTNPCMVTVVGATNVTATFN
jgi:hypothetical protein